jgi:glutamyl-tRNA reductase
LKHSGPGISAVQVVGTNHKRVSVAARERIAADGGAPAALLERARGELHADELALLRTCNRFEVYFIGPLNGHSASSAVNLLSQAADGEEPVPADKIYYLSGEEAVSHLFEVAAGLDSMVLGEHEILGQVKAALPQAAAAGFAGATLTRLFSHAARAGKRARRETAISSGIFSVGQCGARMALDVLGDLRGRRILVFGAGRMAKVTAKHLAELGATCINVFSRTYERAHDLACIVGGTAVTGAELMDRLHEADVIVGCAAAPHHLIRPEQIHDAMTGREDRPLVVIDLGVPRNVDPAVAQVQNVHLFNIDDLEIVVSQHAGEREQEVARVRSIVAEEVAAFERWREQAKVRDLISQLRGKAEQARQECMKLACRSTCSEHDSEMMDYVTDLLVRKLLHRPIAAIRNAAAGEGEGETDVVAAVRELFGLDPSAGTNAEPDAVPSADEG